MHDVQCTLCVSFPSLFVCQHSGAKTLTRDSSEMMCMYIIILILPRYILIMFYFTTVYCIHHFYRRSLCNEAMSQWPQVWGIWVHRRNILCSRLLFEQWRMQSWPDLWTTNCFLHQSSLPTSSEMCWWRWLYIVTPWTCLCVFQSIHIGVLTC